MHILLPTDVFPPGSVGGAAWSTHTLAHALAQRGYRVTVVVPTQQPDSAPHTTPDTPFAVVRHPYHAPRLPFVQNYYRHERLWPDLANRLTHLGHQHPDEPLLLHAQHVQTAPPAILAGQRLGVPVIVTVRDHWPWDYFATGLHGNRFPAPIHTHPIRRSASHATDLLARLGALRGTLALAALPYILAHMRRRAAFLARADAIVAVSSYIRNRLTHLVSAERLHVIANMVDSTAVERTAATPPETPLPIDFLLYIGKLERNKGAELLPPIFRTLRQTDPELPIPPLLVAGSGTLRAPLEAELTAAGVQARFLSWVSHDEIVRLLARCTVLLFPSAWGEPLSRVLLEASALGAPIVAMPTGGTRDILTDGDNGLLAPTPESFAARLRWLLHHPEERQQIGTRARQVAQQRFSIPAVLPRVEALYRQVLRLNYPA